jgi:hypothetical protein
MKIIQSVKRLRLKRLLYLALAGAALYWFIGHVREQRHRDSLAGVMVSGVHHLGPNFNIATFYLDGHNIANVGREGGGGYVCCTMLPRKWRPGLTVELRWEVNDWTNEKPSETDAGNYNSVSGSGSAYIAQVPVERYEAAEHVWVHFYPGGRARVVSSPTGYWGAKHPIQNKDPHAIDSAAQGRSVDALFTAQELAELKRKDKEGKATFGDWR